MKNLDPEKIMSLQANNRVIEKEVVLVICPYCRHRNPQQNTKCEKCGAFL